MQDDLGKNVGQDAGKDGFWHRLKSGLGKTRAQLARKAITNVRENFSQQAMCRKTLDVYEEILQSKAD